MGIWENRGNKDVNSGYDRGECCLSAVFFALFTCWNVQFWRIFALFFFLQINFYLESVFIHVAIIYANLLEQKKVFA